MKIKLLKTVKSKFIAITLVLIILSVGIPSIFLMNQFKQNFDQRSEIMIMSAMDIVIRGLYDRMLNTDHSDVQEIVNEIAKNAGIDHIRIIDKEGIILFSSDSDERYKKINMVSSHHVFESFSDSIVLTKIDDQNMYSAIQPIYNTPNCQRCHDHDEHLGYIDIDTKLTQAESYFQTGSRHIIFLAIAIVIILFLIFYFVFRKLINQPLQNFINAMNRVRSGNFETALPAKKDDEIGSLEQNFNNMVRQLSDSRKMIEEMHFEQLRHADKLVTLGELAAEMAHEINNPAAIIMSRADYLQLESEDDQNLVKYSEDLDVIVNQIQRVSKITQNILRYSKKLPKNFEKIDLIHIINDSIKILEPRLEKSDVKLNKLFRCNKAFIFGDAAQIDQVITNLINNSIDAMEKEGQLTIEVQITSENKVQLLISDNGPGIAEHYRDKIFAPFFTTKSGNKGTGLGLYIVKNICKNHEAEIQCISNHNKGTKFIIEFKVLKEL